MASGLWKADAIASPIDGKLVSTWLDISGNGRHLSQGTTNLQPRLMLDQLNGYPSVRFDGTDDFLASAVNLSAFLGANGLGTFVGLVRFKKYTAPDAADHGVWGVNLNVFTTGGTKLELLYTADPYAWSAGNRDSGGVDSVTDDVPPFTAASEQDPDMDPGVITCHPQIVMWAHDPVTADKLYLGINNLDDIALKSVATGDSTNLAATLLFGRSYEDYWIGDIFEAAFYNTFLSQAERRAVILYFAAKYGLAYSCDGLPSGGGTPLGARPVKVEMLLPTVELQTGTTQLGDAAANPRPFEFSRILRPSLHLMADAITGLSDGDPISTWPDSSGNGHDFTQSGTARPIYKTGILNGKPIVRFDGINDVMLSSDNLEKILGYDGWGVVYVVFRIATNPASIHPLWTSAAADVKVGLLVDENGSDFLRAANDDGTDDTVDEAYTIGQWDIGTWMHSKVGGGNDDVPDELFVAVSSISGSNVASGATASSHLIGIMEIGGDVSGGNYGKVDIAEMIFFPKAQPANTRRHVHSYLKAKYNITNYTDTPDPMPWWLDVTEDVLMKEPIRLQSGSRGSSAENRVASPGSLTFAMNNAVDNSGGQIGYYSPKHSNARSGWDLGVKVRVGIAYLGATYYKWAGYVSGIAPHPGFDSYVVDVKAVDWIDYAGRVYSERLAIQENKDGGELCWRVVINSPIDPTSLVFHRGSITYPFAFDRGADEGNLILNEIHKITRSEFGFTTIKGDIMGGGRLVFEPQGFREDENDYVRWSVSATDIIQELLLEDYSLESMANRVVLELHPRRVDDAATTELFRLQSELLIPAGETIPFVCPYRDPAGKFVRVGGKDMVTPVATTDYTMFTASGGGGSDITADLAPTMTFGANSALASLKNNNAADGYVNLFKLRGKGLYHEESVVIDVKDQTSIDQYGQQMLSVDMPYQSDVAVVSVLANKLLNNYKEPVPRVKSIGFAANKTADALLHALAREPGERIAVTESVSGLASDEYFIHGVEMGIQDGIIVCSWSLFPVDLEYDLGFGA